MTALLLTAMLSAAPVQYVYEFQLRGERVGVVMVELSGTTYRYGAVQVVNRAGHVQRRRRGDVLELLPESQTFQGRVPLTWALVTMASEKGCVDVVDEVTRKAGEHCVTSVDGPAARGTVMGKPFVVTLDARGVASEVRFDEDLAVFKRVPEFVVPGAPADVSGDGYPLPNGPGRLDVEPPLEVSSPSLRVVDRARAVELMEQVSAEEHLFCVDFARAYAKRVGAGKAAVVHGLRIDDGRAYPHAWVRVETADGALQLDPTFGVVVSAERYLPLLNVATAQDEQRTGELWLSLLNGKRRVVRR